MVYNGWTSCKIISATLHLAPLTILFNCHVKLTAYSNVSTQEPTKEEGTSRILVSKPGVVKCVKEGWVLPLAIFHSTGSLQCRSKILKLASNACAVVTNVFWVRLPLFSSVISLAASCVSNFGLETGINHATNESHRKVRVPISILQINVPASISAKTSV